MCAPLDRGLVIVNQLSVISENQLYEHRVVQRRRKRQQDVSEEFPMSRKKLVVKIAKKKMVALGLSALVINPVLMACHLLIFVCADAGLIVLPLPAFTASTH